MHMTLRLARRSLTVVYEYVGHVVPGVEEGKEICPLDIERAAYLLTGRRYTVRSQTNEFAPRTVGAIHGELSRTTYYLSPDEA